LYLKMLKGKPIEFRKLWTKYNIKVTKLSIKKDFSKKKKLLWVFGSIASCPARIEIF